LIVVKKKIDILKEDFWICPIAEAEFLYSTFKGMAIAYVPDCGKCGTL
jgi:hypothetical protein